MEETTSSVQPGTNELNRLILAPIKAIKFRTYKRTVPPFWNRLSINKDWRPYPMTTSVEQIEQQVTATREAEEWEDRCVECNQLVAPVASRILTQVKRIPGRTRSMESLSKSDEQRLVGHFEVVGEEAIIGQFSKSRSIKRRKIPIEIEERFYQNYFETAKSESKSTYDSLPTIAARSESEQMLANCLH